jgi:non-ribosomal peptide synthetase component E (peptide arylation enzyme)
MPPRVPWETIPEMVLSTADRFADAEAIVDGDLRLTFTELAARVRRAAGAFAEARSARRSWCWRRVPRSPPAS